MQNFHLQNNKRMNIEYFVLHVFRDYDIDARKQRDRDIRFLHVPPNMVGL